jgi:hypothetical protein
LPGPAGHPVDIVMIRKETRRAGILGRISGRRVVPSIAAAALMVLSAPPAHARDLRPPANTTRAGQSYLFVDPGYAPPRLSNDVLQSMDPSNDPSTGTMFGEDEQDAMPSPFGLDDQD